MKISHITWTTFLTVEPVLLLYACGFFMSMPIQKQFIYSCYSEDIGFPYNPRDDKSSGCGELNNNNDTLIKMENQVQKLATTFDSMIILCQFIPSLTIGLFIGPWTDTGGRKPAILMACLGAVQEALLMIGTMYFKWPIYVILLGKLFNGLTGFFSSLVQASFAYVSDTTDPSLVSTRLAVLQLVIFTGGFLGQAFSGIATARYGFILPYLGILVCLLASFIYSFLFMPKSVLPKTSKQSNFFTIKSIKRVIDVFTSSRSSSDQKSLLVLVLINTLFSLVQMGTNGVIMLYLMRSPICLTSTALGAFYAFRFVMEGLGGVVGVVLLKKFLQERNITRVGLLSLGLSFLWLAFVQNKLFVFTVPIVSAVSGILMPMTKGQISNRVAPNEQGAIFTGVIALEAFALIIGSLLCNSLYIHYSTAGHPQMVFIACGIFSLLLICLTSALPKPKEE